MNAANNLEKKVHRESLSQTGMFCLLRSLCAIDVCCLASYLLRGYQNGSLQVIKQLGTTFLIVSYGELYLLF